MCERSQSSRLDLILLALALLLAGILNWRAFVQDNLGIDEHVSFWIADRSSPSTLLVRSFHYSATPPLSFFLQRLSLETFGPHEWALRVPAALSYLASVVVIWCTGRRWPTPLVGGMAAILLATQPALLRVAVAGRPYSIGVLLGILAMHCTSRLRADVSQRLRWLWWGLVNLALIQTHYLFGALWAAELVWLLWPGSTRRPRPRELFWLLGILAGCALSVGPGLLRVWDERQFLNWTTRKVELADLLALTLPVDWTSFRQPAAWGVCLMPFIWLTLVHRTWPLRWVDVSRLQSLANPVGRAATWAAIPMGGLWLLGRFWIESVAAERYLVIFVPGVVLTLAGLLSTLRGTVAPLLAMSALVLLGGTVPQAFSQPGGTASPREREWQVVAREFFEFRVSSDDLVLVGSGLTEMTLVPVHASDAIFHDYVTCRLGRMYIRGEYRRLSLPMFWRPEVKGFYRREIARACAAANRESGQEPAKIWLVAATDTDLLRLSLAQTEALVRELGLKEYRRHNLETLCVVVYECSGTTVDRR